MRRKRYFVTVRGVEDVAPYNVYHHSSVGTGVPDCPFGRKCYFMPIRVAEDVDPYNV